VKVLDLFSGIGGFSLGLERAGMETVAFCEFDKHARKVLNKHWPDVPVYEDVRELTNERLKSDGITGIDVITGGFPCQDISVAGKQAGIGEGTRSGLWSECARLVGEIRPDFAVFENVTALLSGEHGRWFQRVLFDLSQIGYDAEWHCIPASELGAHHHRDRVWIIAYPQCQGRKRLIQDDWFFGGKRASHPVTNNGIVNFWMPLADCRGSLRKSNDVPLKPYRDRVRMLGNSVVPQIPELIGRAIMADLLGEL
jgi:DNA (cytosine-5)-methyltransferase 1